MKAYQCLDCDHIQEGRNGLYCGDNDYLDKCENCRSIESLGEIEIDEKRFYEAE